LERAEITEKQQTLKQRNSNYCISSSSRRSVI